MELEFKFKIYIIYILSLLYYIIVDESKRDSYVEKNFRNLVIVLDYIL